MTPRDFSAILRYVIIGAIFPIAQARVFSGEQPSGQPSSTQPAPTTQPASTTAAASYRIKSVIIPPDSAWRKDPKLHNPPDLFVIVRKAGEQIGRESDDMRGWEVEFPKNSIDYYWIDGDDDTSYTVEVWDDQWNGDVQIVTIVNIKTADFKKPIVERISKIDPPERAVRVEFQANQ